jgi:hypothetical protein
MSDQTPRTRDVRARHARGGDTCTDCGLKNEEGKNDGRNTNQQRW